MNTDKLDVIATKYTGKGCLSSRNLQKTYITLIQSEILLRRRQQLRTEDNLLIVAYLGDNSLFNSGLSPKVFLRGSHILHDWRAEFGGKTYKFRRVFMIVHLQRTYKKIPLFIN